jgi:hypothetical protein
MTGAQTGLRLDCQTLIPTTASQVMRGSWATASRALPRIQGYDPAGMAKSFFMAGQAEGFDITDKSEMNAFAAV